MTFTETARRDRASADRREVDRPSLRETWPIGWADVAALLGAFAAFVGLGWIIGIAIVSLSDTPLGRFDSAVSDWFAARRTPTLDMLTDFGSGLSDTMTVVAVIGIVSAVMLFGWRRWREPLVLMSALLLEVCSFVTIAALVGRDRPPIGQLDPSPPTSGFPSGHTAAAVALYVGIALIVHWNTKNVIARRWSIALAVFAPLAVAVSRMYRGMHYLTDVTVGALLGAACLAVAVALIKRRDANLPTPPIVGDQNQQESMRTSS
ncbi:MAG: phosphatase PAP2 family protein [Acidimicrobiia bacterium]|nr:phosphatase PAP2 family protein [Acidimicrobiia bacterium]